MKLLAVLLHGTLISRFSSSALAYLALNDDLTSSISSATFERYGSIHCCCQPRSATSQTANQINALHAHHPPSNTLCTGPKMKESSIILSR
jgi:hypothetical protein